MYIYGLEIPEEEKYRRRSFRRFRQLGRERDLEFVLGKVLRLWQTPPFGRKYPLSHFPLTKYTFYRFQKAPHVRKNPHADVEMLRVLYCQLGVWLGSREKLYSTAQSWENSLAALTHQPQVVMTMMMMFIPPL